MGGTTRRVGRPVRGRHPRRAATMQDVAKQVGVSHQTVSRVLNGSDSVSDETRARVLQAIEDLGYRRNSAARALVTRRSQVLGVVGFDTTLYGPTSTLFAIEQAAREAGYFVSVASVKAPTAGTVRAAVDRLTEQNVDGVVVIAPLRTGEPLSGLPTGLPAVVVDARSSAGLASVRVDQEAGGRLATGHLLDQGSAHGLARRRAGRLVRRAGPAGRVAGGAAGPRRAGAPAAARLVERGLRLRSRPAASPAAGRRRRLRGQRPDDARPAARPARGRDPGT